MKPKENTNVITNRVEDESSVVRNFKIASGATVDPNALVVTNVVKASEVRSRYFWHTVTTSYAVFENNIQMEGSTSCT